MGHLVLVFNDSEADRTPLSISRSLDEGRTWETPLKLESNPGEYSYPCVIQTTDSRFISLTRFGATRSNTWSWMRTGSCIWNVRTDSLRPLRNGSHETGSRQNRLCGQPSITVGSSSCRSLLLVNGGTCQRKMICPWASSGTAALANVSSSLTQRPMERSNCRAKTTVANGSRSRWQRTASAIKSSS